MISIYLIYLIYLICLIYLHVSPFVPIYCHTEWNFNEDTVMGISVISINTQNSNHANMEIFHQCVGWSV